MASTYVPLCVCRSIPCDVLLLQVDLDPDPDPTPQLDASSALYCAAVWCAALHSTVPWQLSWREIDPQLALMGGGEEEERSGWLLVMKTRGLGMGM